MSPVLSASTCSTASLRPPWVRWAGSGWSTGERWGMGTWLKERYCLHCKFYLTSAAVTAISSITAYNDST